MFASLTIVGVATYIIYRKYLREVSSKPPTEPKSKEEMVALLKRTTFTRVFTHSEMKILTHNQIEKVMLTVDRANYAEVDNPYLDRAIPIGNHIYN